jgi:hypothetical protein
VKKPLPLVDEVDLKGSYANEVLHLTGKADVTWKSFKSTMEVTYRRKDGDEDGKFSGKAGFDITTEKAAGHIDLAFDEAGRYSGGGWFSYQVTKDIRPKLGVEFNKEHKLRMFGEVAIGDIPLTRKWPSPEGGKLTFIKGLGAKFTIPTPVPAVTAYGEIKVSAGLGYGVGPVMLSGIKFNGELYPLEEDLQIKAKLVGRLQVPAYAELYGTFGAYIGVEVALGAVGAKGGIEVTPSVRIDGKGGIDVDAEYLAGAFSFSAEAFAEGQLSARLKVDLMAELYAAWGLFSHTWVYNVASLSKQIGPTLRLTIGKVGYKNGELTWPSLSQIKLEPESIDPLEIVKDLMRSGKAIEK